MNLTREPRLYAGMLQYRNTDGLALYEAETALFLRGRISKILYSAMTDDQAGKETMGRLSKRFGILVAHDTYTGPWLKSTQKLESELECVHCVYVEGVPPAVALPEDFVINRLDASHTQKIIVLYRHSMESLTNEQYTGECLQGGVYGAFYKGELCGFIGVHEQEGIGILEVHPK